MLQAKIVLGMCDFSKIIQELRGKFPVFPSPVLSLLCHASFTTDIDKCKNLQKKNAAKLVRVIEQKLKKGSKHSDGCKALPPTLMQSVP